MRREGPQGWRGEPLIVSNMERRDYFEAFVRVGKGKKKKSGNPAVGQTRAPVGEDHN